MRWSAWAAGNGYPLLLLSTQAGLHATPDAWLRDHCDRIDKVWILGGTAALTSAVESATRAAVADPDRGCNSSPADVVRVHGPDRYATAVAIAERMFGAPVGAIVATGMNWPDGIAGGPLATINADAGGTAVASRRALTDLDQATRS